MIPAPEETTRDSHRRTGERETLEGWAAVENEMMKQDEGTMKGYTSDVDTLLVFAGLFSAVLTAFTVESYQQLQVDTGQKSMVLLERISIQLESFTLSSGFANSSARPPLPSLDFSVDVTARWINILWFLSLIFSLAAALFGILVKQWIREYMQWNDALATPRDNVLIRQIRFEAWNDWNVPTTIAVIPALLELALVLFVCGPAALLWMLDTVVSIVITTTAVVFLAAASTFIVLPAFFVRCPYKSPTAWACAVVWDFITLRIPLLLVRILYWFWAKAPMWCPERLSRWIWRTRMYIRCGMATWEPLTASWRHRDLASVWTSPVTQTRRGDISPILQELLRLDRARTDTPAETVEPQYDVSSFWVRKEQRAALHNAIRTITELPPLVRALVWVLQASQDAHVQETITRCIQALDSHFVLPDPTSIRTPTGELLVITQDGIRTLSLWNFIASGSPDVSAALRLNDVRQPSITSIRRRAYTRYSRSPSYITGQWSVELSRGALPELHILLQLLTLSVKALVEGLVKERLGDAEAESNARIAREQLGVVLWISQYKTKNTLPLQIAAQSLMEALIVSSGDTHESFESTFPGLRWDIFRTAKELRNRGTPWSLLEELHVELPAGLILRDGQVKWSVSHPVYRRGAAGEVEGAGVEHHEGAEVDNTAIGRRQLASPSTDAIPSRHEDHAHSSGGADAEHLDTQQPTLDHTATAPRRMTPSVDIPRSGWDEGGTVNLEGGGLEEEPPLDKEADNTAGESHDSPSPSGGGGASAGAEDPQDPTVRVGVTAPQPVLPGNNNSEDQDDGTHAERADPQDATLDSSAIVLRPFMPGSSTK